MTPKRKTEESRDDLIVAPLDYMILGELPDEGAMIFGAYPDGKTAADLAKAVAGGQLNATLISTRMRVLHANVGAVVTQKSVQTGAKFVYQRTALGAKLLRKWEAEQSSNGSST